MELQDEHHLRVNASIHELGGMMSYLKGHFRKFLKTGTIALPFLTVLASLEPTAHTAEIKLLCRSQDVKFDQAKNFLTECSNVADETIYGSSVTGEKGIMDLLIQHVDDLYAGKLPGPFTGDPSANTTQTIPNFPPVCSLQLGPIQKKLRERKGLPTNGALEDQTNWKSESCGNQIRYQFTRMCSPGAIICTFLNWNPEIAKVQSYPNWEGSHQKGLYLLALEEALLEALDEMQANRALSVNSSLGSSVTQLNTSLAEQRSAAARSQIQSGNNQAASTEAATLGDQDLFIQQVSQCLATEKTTNAAGNANLKVRLGLKTPATPQSAPELELDSLRQRANFLCGAWKASQAQTKHLIAAEIFLRADEKMRQIQTGGQFARDFAAFLSQTESTCEQRVKSKWDDCLASPSCYQTELNNCVLPKTKQFILDQGRTLFPRLTRENGS